MEDRYVDKIVEYFCSIYEKLKLDGIVNDYDLSHPAKNNLHSWLQYALVLAGTQAGLHSPPEIKIDFDESHLLDPATWKIKKRLRRFSRVDVGFFRQSSLEGFAEVHTTNDATVFLETKVFEDSKKSGLIKKENKFTIMHRDVLMHTLKNTKQKKPNFVILVVTLPKVAPFNWLKIQQEDEQVRRMIEVLEEGKKKKNLDKACRWGWIKLRDDIRRETNTDCSLIVINEDGAEFVKPQRTNN